jgi:hypothetical protein
MSVTQDKLYDFAGIEVTTNEFSVVRELLKSLDKDHVGFHERVAYRRHPIQDLLGHSGRRARKRADEVDVRIWPLRTLVQTLEPEGHGGREGMCRGVVVIAGGAGGAMTSYWG